MRSFGTFTFEDMYDLFQVDRIDNIPLLTEWINTDIALTQSETENLERLKKHLSKQILAWNEDELKMFFIGPIIELADLETKEFKPFTQRMLSATIQGIEVNGRVDFMISKGMRTAKAPYFCIHEYTCTEVVEALETSRSEQEVDSDGEPLGQLLIAMLAAQTLNEKKIPILGAYIMGRNWFFVVLADHQYAVSKAFDATEDEIHQIYSILKKSKEIIIRSLS